MSLESDLSLKELKELHYKVIELGDSRRYMELNHLADTIIAEGEVNKLNTLEFALLYLDTSKEIGEIYVRVTNAFTISMNKIKNNKK